VLPQSAPSHSLQRKPIDQEPGNAICRARVDVCAAQTGRAAVMAEAARSAFGMVAEPYAYVVVRASALEVAD